MKDVIRVEYVGDRVYVEGEALRKPSPGNYGTEVHAGLKNALEAKLGSGKGQLTEKQRARRQLELLILRAMVSQQLIDEDALSRLPSDLWHKVPLNVAPRSFVQTIIFARSRIAVNAKKEYLVKARSAA